MIRMNRGYILADKKTLPTSGMCPWRERKISLFSWFVGEADSGNGRTKSSHRGIDLFASRSLKSN